MTRHGFRKSRQAPLPRNIYRRTPLANRSGSNRFAPRTPEPACGMKSQCGACKYVNQDYSEGLQAKFQAGVAILQEAQVLSKSRVLAPVPSPHPLAYRSLAKLAVRPARPNAIGFAQSYSPEGERLVNRFGIGLFASGSHDIVDMDSCPLHTQPIKNLLYDLRSELNRSPLTPYDEQRHTGQVRYIAIRAAHLTGELMITFVVTEPLKVELRRLISSLQRRGHKINSVHMNLNTEPGNAIFGGTTIRLAGSERLRESLCDLAFEVGPTSFFQVNPWQAINLYRRVETVAGAATGRAPVAWDLYCGTGQISLVLARLGYRVLGVEENDAAVKDAEANARKNRLADSATFLAARVEDAEDLLPSWSQSPSLIVVNPSRRGLAESKRKHVARMLANQPQARFLYVSCDVNTLARDLKVICELSGFQVRQVEPFDMFPQTDNMEWLAVLNRS